jgi:hypothetical protein
VSAGAGHLRRFAIIFLLAGCIGHAAVVPTNSAVVTTNAYPLQIVTCRKDVDTEALLKEFHITLKSPKHHFHALKGFAALLDDATIKKLKADPRVLFVEADGPASVSGPPPQYGPIRIGIPQFPLARINGTNEPLDVDVAIIDTGIDPHEALDTYNNDFYATGDDASDAAGHGTQVAGVVAMKDNSLGLIGVAPGVRIWNVKVAGALTGTPWSFVLSGMDFVYQNADQISVANMSFNNTGAGAPVHAIQLEVDALVSAGVVLVVSAGNASHDLAGPDGIYGTGDDPLPAGLPDAMAVSAMDPTPYLDGHLPTDLIWSNSNFSQVVRTNGYLSGETNHVFSPGGAIDVAAPGVNIFTTAARSAGQTISSNYAISTGTSLAAPHVTGLVALYIAANGRATNATGVYRIRQAIVDNGQPQSQWMPKGLPFNAVTNPTGDPDTNPEPLAIASENWVPRPAITHAAGGPGNFQVNFATVPGYDYMVQVATNLAPPTVWSNLTTVTGGSNLAPVSVTDTNLAVQSFYRLARQSLLGRLNLLAQPQSATNVVGTVATMGVTVTGDAPGYRWQKDGAPLTDGGRISGAATVALTLTGVKSVDAGGYSVVITNVYGSVTSAVAMLTIQSVVPVTGVLASATSELGPTYGRYASNAVNGITYDSNPWESVGVGQGFGNDPSPAITFDLGSVCAVDHAQIWNGHEAGPSVKRMLVETSSDGTTFTPVGNFTLTTISPASETIAFGRVTGRFVRFTILENASGQLFPVVGPPTAGTLVMIDEVGFYEYLADGVSNR